MHLYVYIKNMIFDIVSQINLDVITKADLE